MDFIGYCYMGCTIIIKGCLKTISIMWILVFIHSY